MCVRGGRGPAPGRGGVAPPARTGERRELALRAVAAAVPLGEIPRAARGLGVARAVRGGGVAVPSRAAPVVGPSGCGGGPGSGTPSVLPPCPRRRPRLSRPGPPRSPRAPAAAARPGSAPAPSLRPRRRSRPYALSGRLAPRPSRARGRAPGMRAPAAARGTPRRRPPLRASPRVVAAPRCAPRARGGWVGARRGVVGGRRVVRRSVRRSAPGCVCACGGERRVACRGSGWGGGRRSGATAAPRPPPGPARARAPPPPNSGPRARVRAAPARGPRLPPPRLPLLPSPAGPPPVPPARAPRPPARVSVTGRASTVAFPCRGPPSARASPLPFSRPRAPRAPPTPLRGRWGGAPSETRPQIRRGDPLNLSILVSGGKETNQDSLSNGE